jgi:sucrose-phosphate synthase
MAHRGSATGERDARLEYLSWRVWGMKRKHALLTEQALADGAETDVVAADVEDTDLSDISPIPDHSTLPVAAAAEALGAPGLRPLRVTTVTRAPSDASADGVTSPLGSPDRVAAPITNPQLTKQRVPKLYCVLISMHGLVRGEHMELGKDPDTGGCFRGAPEPSVLPWL